MKWGVRRYQNKDGSLTAEGKIRYRSKNVKMRGTGKETNYDHDTNSKDRFKKKQLQRALLSVAFLNPIPLAFMAADTVKSTVSVQKEKKALKEQAKTPIDKKTGLHLKPEGKEYTKKEDAKSVNPAYADFSDNTKNNCMLCTTAYDLRRRGYNVLAKKASTGYDDDIITHCYPKAKKHVPKQTITKKNGKVVVSKKLMKENTKKDLLAQGEGARGNLCVTWDNSFSGHSVAYEVENGKVNIYDAQCGKKMSLDSILSKSRECYTFRLDNVEFDKKAIKDAVR